MSSETENLEFSPTNIFIENNVPREKPLHKGFFVLKKELLVMLMTVVLVLGIPLLILSIYSFKEQNLLNEKMKEQNEKMKDQNETIDAIANEIKLLESSKKFMGFGRIGKYGYFQKLDEKMTYEDGQKACSKIFGQVIEFDETSNDFSGGSQICY